MFDAVQDGERALWARRERGLWPPWNGRPGSTPTRLTTGPLSYGAPTLSPDGQTLYALGRPPSVGGELVRYDAPSRFFVPFLGGVSARHVEFSRDGRSIAYVLHPEGTLWRSRADGTDRRQLTFAPTHVALPRWSPDGRRIAFFSREGDQPWWIYIVGADGGKPQPVTGHPGEVDPNWSPDGENLVFGVIVDFTPARPAVIQVVNVRSGGVSPIPGSEGLYSPRWSPDGRFLAALSADATRLVLYDFAGRRWRDLVAGTDALGFPSWTRDGTRIQLWKGGSIVRVRAADGRIEPVAQVERIAFVTAPVGPWIGIAPDDSPIALRETGPPEVYALDVEWP